MFMAWMKAWWMNKKDEMSSVAKYAKPKNVFYFHPFLMMQLYECVVEHHEIEHHSTSHQMLWSLESKFTMNATHVLTNFKLVNFTLI